MAWVGELRIWTGVLDEQKGCAGVTADTMQLGFMVQ